MQCIVQFHKEDGNKLRCFSYPNSLEIQPDIRTKVDKRYFSGLKLRKQFSMQYNVIFSFVCSQRTENGVTMESRQLHYRNKNRTNSRGLTSQKIRKLGFESINTISNVKQILPPFKLRDFIVLILWVGGEGAEFICISIFTNYKVYNIIC